ncbi:predicted protein [Naegleria gruberi]|uniref:Predicted protein n=1 Tax=Naegleria gruberi TaxID=5762 RepID=D2VFX6_NAEGR|nr:uncharacterized protein NAEGRDRAFT_67779 [Naegleria gruberi]EFC44266.1 predicted protein [Naegleria gruberi]|eukprot:XP_002677010.1 predicted protein [Naegleria gruberi strain NEG-M]
MPPKKKQSTKKRKKDDTDSDDDYSEDVIGEEELVETKSKYDWSTINIDATVKRFHELDQQILKLEEERQQALKILKSHPQTLVQYSTVNRYEKTKEGFQSSGFYDLGSDCLTLIFDFCFARQVVEAPFVIKLFGMTTKIRQALLNSNFILGIAQPNYKFNVKAMPIFTRLYGLEIVLDSDRITIADHLLKKGSKLSHLVVRDDISLEKNSLTEELKDKIKSIQHFSSRNARSRNTFGSFNSLEHFSTLSFCRVSKIPNAKSAIITAPTVEFGYIPQLFEKITDLLVVICPSCKTSKANFSEDRLFGTIKAKYFVSVRFQSKSKKPDLMASSSFSVKIFEQVEGLDDDAPSSSKYLAMPNQIHFTSNYRDAFEKIEGIQYHTNDIPGFFKTQF